MSPAQAVEKPRRILMRQSSGGVCAGGKKPTARSIKQDFETFLNVSKSAQRGEKTFSTRCAGL